MKCVICCHRDVEDNGNICLRCSWMILSNTLCRDVHTGPKDQNGIRGIMSIVTPKRREDLREGCFKHLED